MIEELFGGMGEISLQNIFSWFFDLITKVLKILGIWSLPEVCVCLWGRL